MLKRIKNIAVFVLVTFYVLQVCIVFSGTLIEHIQEIRNQIQLSKIHLAQTKIVTIAQWESNKDKKEIKINNHYYDVLSYKILSNKVRLVAVRDSHENNFRVVLNNLLNKNNTSHSEKKKSLKIPNFITVLNKNDYEFKKNRIFILKKMLFYASKKSPVKIIIDVYKPPC